MSGPPTRDLTPRVSVLYSVQCTGIHAPSSTANQEELPSAAPGTGQEIQLPILCFLRFFRSVWGWGWGGGILKWPLGIGRLWDSCRQRACSREREAWGPKNTWTLELAQVLSWLITVWADELGDLRPALCLADKQLFCPPASWLPGHVAQKSSNHQRGRTTTISQAFLNVQRRGLPWWPSG